MVERIFVGEKRSQTAIKRDWTWEDRHLAAKQLFDALVKSGIDPDEQEFLNLFDDDGQVDVEALDKLIHAETPIVAMGKRVHHLLEQFDIPHTEIVHPAARGKIRNKVIYQLHIEERLGK